MTRINLLCPSELYDQHLMAEYREIQHVPMALQRSLNKKHGFSVEEIPKSFTLNAGHVKFFYNKGLYLHKRFELIKQELLKRRFAITVKTFRMDLFPSDFQNDWIPSEYDVMIVRERIQEKINLKPHWYKKTMP